MGTQSDNSEKPRFDRIITQKWLEALPDALIKTARELNERLNRIAQRRKEAFVQLQKIFDQQPQEDVMSSGKLSETKQRDKQNQPKPPQS